MLFGLGVGEMLVQCMGFDVINGIHPSTVTLLREPQGFEVTLLRTEGLMLSALMDVVAGSRRYLAPSCSMGTLDGYYPTS